MKVAVLTISYREDKFIEAVIKNWVGKVHTHLILESSKAWHGLDLPPDRTKEICDLHQHVQYVSLAWPSETAQRNWGLGYLYDYDYVLVVDADELYTQADQLTILSSIGVPNKYEDNQWAYRANQVVTYFKTPEYVLDPPDTHKPIVAVNPKKVVFIENRVPSTDYQIPIEVRLHHLSYLRDDLRLFHKLQQFEHYDQVRKNWFQEVWQNWTPETENIRAYGEEKSKAIKQPMPKELCSIME